DGVYLVFEGEDGGGGVGDVVADGIFGKGFSCGASRHANPPGHETEGLWHGVGSAATFAGGSRCLTCGRAAARQEEGCGREKEGECCGFRDGAGSERNI